ncbi:MAG: MBL fold metallo-hydrolase [Deltaproteobacteria bacterium]|nr:MBL fold metallo-hydrolase [Deltaproteobacteria bacterium]
MGRTPAEVDALFLSHGHPDHYGGLLGFLEWRGTPLPIYCHPDVFWPKYLMTPRGKVGPWKLEREKIEETGAQLTCATDAQQLREGIPRRTDFEGPMPGAKIIKDGEDMDDSLVDEQALVVNLGEKGLVIISGCSHPGIVNTIQYAQEITGNSRIYAVIGGLHLAQVGEEVLTQTINGIKDSRKSSTYPRVCLLFSQTLRHQDIITFLPQKSLNLGMIYYVFQLYLPIFFYLEQF